MFLAIVHVPLEFWKSVLVPWVCDKTSRKNKGKRSVTHTCALDSLNKSNLRHHCNCYVSFHWLIFIILGFKFSIYTHTKYVPISVLDNIIKCVTPRGPATFTKSLTTFFLFTWHFIYWQIQQIYKSILLIIAGSVISECLLKHKRHIFRCKTGTFNNYLLINYWSINQSINQSVDQSITPKLYLSLKV